MRAALVFAIGYLVWQPIGYWLVHLLLPGPRAIVTRHDWMIFETSAAVLGAVAGVWWYYSRRPTPRTRAQYWADAGLPVLTFAATLNADRLVGMPWPIADLIVVLTAVICGVLFGSVALVVAKSINSSAEG